VSKELSVRLNPAAIAASPAIWLRNAASYLPAATDCSLRHIGCPSTSLPGCRSPWPPLPLLLIGLLLTPRLAAAHLLAYLARRTGLPVFAPTPAFTGGLPICLGPRAATCLLSPSPSLISFPLAAALSADFPQALICRRRRQPLSKP